MPPSVRTRGLRRSFGPVTALDGVDLDVEGPAVVGVAGPNGSGKTTLVRCLLGLLRPDAGSVAVDGTDPLSFDAADRARLGYMPQHEAVYRDLTARANVDFFARLYGVDDRAAAVRRALDLVDLTDRADDRVATLSGGMVRRTSLACAVVHDPDLLVLDEPTVGLDPALRASMWDGFRRRRDDGALVLVSTHYLSEADNCDRLALLRAGRVLAFDAPDTLRERTGAATLEGAFLALLDERGSEARGAAGSDAAGRPEDAVEPTDDATEPGPAAGTAADGTEVDDA